MDFEKFPGFGIILQKVFKNIPLAGWKAFHYPRVKTFKLWLMLLIAILGAVLVKALRGSPGAPPPGCGPGRRIGALPAAG